MERCAGGRGERQKAKGERRKAKVPRIRTAPANVRPACTRNVGPKHPRPATHRRGVLQYAPTTRHPAWCARARRLPSPAKSGEGPGVRAPHARHSKPATPQPPLLRQPSFVVRRSPFAPPHCTALPPQKTPLSREVGRGAGGEGDSVGRRPGRPRQYLAQKTPLAREVGRGAGGEGPLLALSDDSQG